MAGKEREKRVKIDEALVFAAQKWLEERGVVCIIFDLDGTLTETNDLFGEHINEFYQLILGHLPLDSDRKDFKKTIGGLINKAHEAHSVNPIFWEDVLLGLSKEYGVELEILQGNFPVLLEIYEQAPRLKEGALGLLEIFKQTGVEMAVLTHASREWTEIKLKERGLASYFGDNVYTVDTSRPKGPADWAGAMASLGVCPGSVLVIGDSVKGDINAAHKIGVPTKNLICVKAGWEMYSRGVLPEEVITVESLREIPDILLKE